MNIQLRSLLMFAVLSGLSIVALGALGAHAFKGLLSDQEYYWLILGLLFQGFHTVVIMIIAGYLMIEKSIRFYVAALLMIAGCFLFSGTLYLMALVQFMQFHALVPMGGFCFLVSWIFVFSGALYLKSK